jgi:hypothetical protein
MATIKINQFTEWELTDEELPFAYKFNDLNIKALQNEIAIAAQAKIALVFDPNNPIAFAQAEAELAGKIGILQFLVAQSTTKQEF